MNREGFVRELWNLYQRASESGAYMDALVILKEICNHEPKEKEKDA